MPHSWIRNWMDCSWRYCVIIYFKYLYLWRNVYLDISFLFVTMMEVKFELFVIAVSEFGTSTIGNLTSNSHNQQFLHKTRFNLKGHLQFGIPLNKRLLGNHPFYPDFFMLQNLTLWFVSCRVGLFWCWAYLCYQWWWPPYCTLRYQDFQKKAGSPCLNSKT